MDPTDDSHAQQLLTKFISFCDKQKITPNSESLSQYYKSVKKPKLKIVIKSKISTPLNDYIVFTNHCRNNGFSVLEFQGKPAVYTDYLHCPNSKLVVMISQVNCIIIRYKVFNIVTPRNNVANIVIDFDIDPMIQEQLEDIQDDVEPSKLSDIDHWNFNHINYLVDLATQQVFLNNSLVGTRQFINQRYFLKSLK
jgi:hypothetical protein